MSHRDNNFAKQNTREKNGATNINRPVMACVKAQILLILAGKFDLPFNSVVSNHLHTDIYNRKINHEEFCQIKYVLRLALNEHDRRATAPTDKR